MLSFMRGTAPALAVVVLVAALRPASVSASPPMFEAAPATADDDANTQVAELYQLQAAFHRAASIHNPNGLDTPHAISERIVEMLSLWTNDGSLTLKTVSPAREFNKGKGEPGTASCAAGSNTLCDFFTSVAGSSSLVIALYRSPRPTRSSSRSTAIRPVSPSSAITSTRTAGRTKPASPSTARQ